LNIEPCASIHGAPFAAAICSLIGSAELNGLDPVVCTRSIGKGCNIIALSRFDAVLH
jgi:hypothetical protein